MQMGSAGIWICLETLLFQSKDQTGLQPAGPQPARAAIVLPIVRQLPFCGHKAGVRYRFGFVALTGK
jgi:hypothetical protein